MYIKSIVIEGFKSYGKRTEINGFDKEFNAITGLNGTGKSNVLDAICFVLGITNLGDVRATSLQELVYKSGLAGIKKASVTVTFDNRDKKSSPLGFDTYPEIVVTRQVVIDGKNKYLINGSNVANKRVVDMFHSVQMNVNNPHFLIMQGRITTVLKMKPLETLSMVEEAAGTKMYEIKKQTALKTIEKKDSKLREINAILNEEIGPKLARLKEERTQYIEFQRVEREIQHCKKVVVAWKYVTALSDSEKADGDIQEVNNKIEEKQKAIDDGLNEISTIEDKVKEIEAKRAAEKGEKLAALEQELKEAEKHEIKLTAETNSNEENIKGEKKKIDQLKSNIAGDEKLLAGKEKDLEKFGGLFKQLKDQDENDRIALQAAREQLEKVRKGLLQSDSGENATLEQQVINAKSLAEQANTEVKQCEMEMKHVKEQLTTRQTQLQSTVNDGREDGKNLENKEKELKSLENELKRLNYVDGPLQELRNEKNALLRDVNNLRDRVDQFETRYPQLNFQYQDPHPGFQRESVKGFVCKLLSLKDKETAYALDIAAGSRLYNVIVDTENTSKALLQRGQLQKRVTIIPLNKIDGRPMDQQTVELAKRLVGEENVEPALSLVNFPEATRKAMAWIFGQVFIVKNMACAKKIAFHERIRKKCVTLEGDVVDPAGTLSGGAKAKGGSILLRMEELNALQKELNQKEERLREIEQQLANVEHTAEKYRVLKEKFDLRSHEANVLKQKLQQTSYHKIKEEVEGLKAKMAELTEKMRAARVTESENTNRLKTLQSQLKDSSNIREKQLKDSENQLKILTEKSSNSRNEWKKREQESESLNLEIEEIRRTIDTQKEEVVQAEEKVVSLEEALVALRDKLREANENVKRIQEVLRGQKEIISRQNKEIQKLLARKEEILKQSTEYELDIKKLAHEINTIKTSAADCKRKVSDLLRHYEWIEQDKAFFGRPGGIYDFEANNPEEITRKMNQLEKIHERLSRNVNSRAMNLLNKEEEQYNEMSKKKKIIELDRSKILETIETLDAQKKETLLKACEQVNKDFGSIFSNLLPGANAKLQPLENQTVLEGLEVKVGFAGKYKDSLSELSGGQRSLVALSLILAMLRFNPAPLYILDEVDAALDLSHTQNIGTILKKHFTTSQFIIVSLKDGMFNNANVLFKTRLVEGMSTVTRTERARNN